MAPKSHAQFLFPECGSENFSNHFSFNQSFFRLVKIVFNKMSDPLTLCCKKNPHLNYCCVFVRVVKLELWLETFAGAVQFSCDHSIFSTFRWIFFLFFMSSLSFSCMIIILEVSAGIQNILLWLTCNDV